MNRIELLLTQLGEEAAEVTQAASKCLRFGPHEGFPAVGPSNAQRVLDEFWDLYALIEMLQAERILPYDIEAGKKIKEKKLKVEKLLEYSKQCGVMS